MAVEKGSKEEQLKRLGERITDDGYETITLEEARKRVVERDKRQEEAVAAVKAAAKNK